MKWWEHLRDWLAGQATKLDLAQLGVSGPMATVSAEISRTGYSTEAERAAARAKLQGLCLELVSDPALRMQDVTGDGIPDTQCSAAVRRACERYGFFGFAGLRANMIVSRLKSGTARGWRPAPAARAIEHALRGGLGIAGKEYQPSGHVAVIAPEPGRLSGSWGKIVPVVANVGKPPNRIMVASEAFPVSQGEPGYWIFGETA